MPDLSVLCSAVVEYAVVCGIFGTTIIQKYFCDFPMLLSSNSLLKKCGIAGASQKNMIKRIVFLILGNS